SRLRSVPDFPKLPPEIYLGEATGVAVNSKGHVFVFSRRNTTGPAYAAAAAQLLEFSPDGKFLREIGHHLYAWSFAHTVKVDKDDNIWVTDKRSEEHTSELQSRVDLVCRLLLEKKKEEYTAPSSLELVN